MRHKQNSILSFLLVSVIILTGISNYKFFRSLNDQLYLLYEWNSFKKIFTTEQIQEFNYTYPNSSITAMPLPFMIGRNLIENEKTQKKGLALIHKTKKINEYLGVHFTELANFYNKKRIKDSVLFYSKKAYYQLPNNLHFNNYIETLKEFGTEKEMDSAFMFTKEKRNEYKWRIYLFNKINRYMTESNKDSLLTIVGEAESFFKDKKSIDVLKNFIQVGSDLEIYSELLFQANSDFDSGNFLTASEKFLKLNLMDPQEKTHLFNIAVCYFKLKNYSEAIIFYKRYLEEFGDSSGKVEFYIASSYLEKSEIDLGCKFLGISLEKGFNSSKVLAESFCN